MRFRFTIGRKLGLGFGVLLVAILVNGILTFTTLKRTKLLNEKIATIYTPSISKLKDLNLLVIKSKSLTVTWLESDKDIEEVEPKKELRTLYEEDYPTLKNEVNLLIKKWEEKDRKRMDSVLAEVDSLMEAEHDIMITFKSEDDYWYPSENVDIRYKLISQFNNQEGVYFKKIEKIKRELEQIIKIKENYANNYSAKMDAAFNMLQNYVLYLGIFLLLGGIAIAFFTIRSIISPINNLKNILSIMGKGILPDNKIPERKDEIGEMSSALNNLVEALKRTSNFSKEIGEGNFKSQYSPLSNRDSLGNSLLVMRDNLAKVAEEDRKRNWTTGGLAKFGEILRNNSDDVSKLSSALISELVKYIEANQGGVFVMNNDDPDDVHMEMTGCYAWDRQKYLDQKVYIGDGLVGQAWQEKDTLYITDIPEDYINISSGLGHANPKCLLIVPIIVNEEVFGVIEIASFREYEDYEIKFVEKVAENTASTISSVKVNQRTKYLLTQAQQATEQMRAQEEELRHNQSQMKDTQKEMEKIIEEYQVQMKQLKISRDQLQEENEVLQNILLKRTKELEKTKQQTSKGS